MTTVTAPAPGAPHATREVIFRAAGVCYRDQDLAQASERTLTGFRRDHVGLVFQFYNLIASLTAFLAWRRLQSLDRVQALKAAE